MAFGILKHAKVSRAKSTSARKVHIRVWVYRADRISMRRRGQRPSLRPSVRSGYCAVAYVTPTRAIGRGMSLSKKHEKRSDTKCGRTPTLAFKAALRDLTRKVK